MKVTIHSSWNRLLKDEFQKNYFKELWKKVDTMCKLKVYRVFPPQELVFNAFNHCHFGNLKVVIIGQDPYHKKEQAHGLAFSVPDGIQTPPSLKNIYKEIENDIGTKPPESGNLERWADQGVLLLNATLTVQEASAGAHQKLGWERFTDTVIQKISEEKEYVVFLLWGSFAQQKAPLIDTSKHLVLTASHPSPLSAYRGFFGCKHFSKTNEYLKNHGINPITW